MWPFKTRRRLERIEEALGQLATQLAGPRLDLNSLVETVLVKKLEAEARVEDSRAGVQEARHKAELDAIEREQALKKSELEFRQEKRKRQQEAGRRRAQTGQRDSLGRLLPSAVNGQPACAVCANPSNSNLTSPQIWAHKAHAS
jgi:hypothetical protein